MTITQVVKTSVTVNNNSPIQDYVHPDDQIQPTCEMTLGFKPFTKGLKELSLIPNPIIVLLFFQNNSFKHLKKAFKTS